MLKVANQYINQTFIHSGGKESEVAVAQAECPDTTTEAETTATEPTVEETTEVRTTLDHTTSTTTSIVTETLPQQPSTSSSRAAFNETSLDEITLARQTSVADETTTAFNVVENVLCESKDTERVKENGKCI